MEKFANERRAGASNEAESGLGFLIVALSLPHPSLLWGRNTAVLGPVSATGSRVMRKVSLGMMRMTYE